MNRYKLIYIFTYAPIGVLCPLIGQYLKHLGFSGTQIGTITAVGTFTSIIAAAFWGKIYSSSTSKNKILAFLCLTAAAISMFSLTASTFLPYTLIYGAMYFFQGPIMGLTDAMALEASVDFSKVRLFGAAGYAVSVFLGGRICDILGLDKIFPIYTITFIIGALLILGIPKEELANFHSIHKTEKAHIGYKVLLKDKPVIYLIIVGIFIFGTNVANNTYFGFLYIDGGGTVSGLGLMFLLMAGSEVPFMALAPVISKKFGINKVILVAITLSFLRFGFYSTGPAWYLLMGTFMLQGMVNGILLVEYIKFISSIVDKKAIGLAVSAFYAVSANMGTICATFLGGIAMDHFGSRGVYGIFAILNFIGLILYLHFKFEKKGKKFKNVVDNERDRW
ncbi:MFS transporter, PPP family, 3-phenylpropionic acid transporter [Peptostreptococcaceae bacterium pGA-8]|nr:MFS transporter, PPP family, 3-phenylpropionic acid transporter [Peptostreptococcaceae bacterium pGA-8]